MMSPEDIPTPDHPDGEVTEERIRRLLDDLGPDLACYRREVAAVARMDAKSQARMRRMLVSLVREDVRRRHADRGLAVRARRGFQRISAVWNQLLAQSAAFRWVHHGALSLGVVLVVFMLWDLSSDSRTTASSSATGVRMERLLPREPSRLGPEGNPAWEPRDALDARRLSESLPEGFQGSRRIRKKR